MESLLSSIVMTVFISVLIKLMIYYYNRLYKTGNKIPCLWPAFPILGNAHLFFGNIDKFISGIILLEDLKFSPVRFWLGNKLCFILFDPEQMKSVLQSPKAIEKDGLYKMLHPLIGTGLLTAPGNKWKVHRKLIAPTLQTNIVKSFIGIMNEQSEILVKVMEPEINGDEFDIFSYVSRCTLDIICESAMGVSVNLQTNKDSTYIKTLERVKSIFGHRMLKVWLHSNFIFGLTQLAKDQAECIEYLHKQTNDVIKQKRQQFSDNISGKNNITQTTGSRTKVFLDLLMELSNEGIKLTNEEIRNEVDTLMVAGHDTTAIINSFIILMLANFPEVQKKCYNELVEIFGEKINNGRQIDYEDLNQMEYLERVIKETLRLFPATPLLFRQVNDNLIIGEEYTLPKGSTVVLGVLRLHRSPDIWEDPLSFNPDRFLPEEVAKRHPYAYIPFSGGPRNCIGMKYAMMSMKILLASLIRNYVFIKDKHVSIQDIKIKAEIFIKPFTPITVKIKRRTITPA